jgi:hypothetical protein
VCSRPFCSAARKLIGAITDSRSEACGGLRLCSWNAVAYTLRTHFSNSAIDMKFLLLAVEPIKEPRDSAT